MLYTDQEAIIKYERIYTIMKDYNLNLLNACIRVGMNPTSFGSLKKRVTKLKEKDEREDCNI